MRALAGKGQLEVCFVFYRNLKITFPFLLVLVHLGTVEH